MFQKVLNILTIFYLVVSQITILLAVGLLVLSLLDIIHQHHAKEPMIAAFAVGGFALANLVILALAKFIYQKSSPVE